MNKLSDGSPATLATYRSIAVFFSSEAVAFIDKKIAESPSGEQEEVLADEGQMLYLLANAKGEL